MTEERMHEIAKQIVDAGPEGDWYLLPPGARGVIGYIFDPAIGDIAYKGKPMNMQAAFEEAIVQAFKVATKDEESVR